ncbi:MAG TPA: adenylyl-sulfate kinase [Nitrospirae bacterium]|nr:septum site-determining protein MinD [bacterium BMS3Abin10]GBE39065.1 septum site-determining protein MinD [bacterium BMS3Bbin08]HDH50373.1 adenylyl-sulfate kinase [Nitrospirota bacterium]HDO25812.1 adenylyl-sulfate kinase [Nitrospirota bacterium]
MKIAITGKGGVGKTTIAALLSHIYALEGKRVIAVDADPDANLAQALGISKAELKEIRPIAEMSDLVEERTGAKPGTSGGIFRINPKVDDIPEGFGYSVDGITLLVMGRSKLAASGCYCPEHALLRRLLKHLIVERDEVVIVDMEAGIEHLTRGTAEGVDAFIVVVEPGQRSLQTAVAVKQLAGELGVKRAFVVANKVRGEQDISFIKNNLSGIEFLGSMSFNNDIMESDIKGLPSYKASQVVVDEAIQIKRSLERLV